MGAGMEVDVGRRGNCFLDEGWVRRSLSVFLFLSPFLFFQTQAFPFMGYLHFERGCALVHIKSLVEGDGIFTRLSAFL